MADPRRENFELDKRVGLRDIDIQAEQLRAERSRGLRDIGQSREQGIEAAVNNALQRGIYNSGIRQENVQAVETEAGEAEFDLRGDIQRALARLSNQRAGVAGTQFIGDGASGPGGAMASMLEAIQLLLDQMQFDPNQFKPASYVGPTAVRGRQG